MSPITGPIRGLSRIAAVTALATGLAGCGQMMTRISEMGDGPALSPITNPQAMPGYRPVSMPMPAPLIPDNNPNSLWRSGAKQFFKDIRAKEVGDTLTVRLRLDDSAKLKNTTNRARNDSEKAALEALFGYNNSINSLLPRNENDASLAAQFGSKTKTQGNGGIDRKEEIGLTVAVVVAQVLPNGSLAIQGRQEIRVNNELRELSISGVVRPQDVDADNSVSHERIAEMRVNYGGRGMLSDLQQPRWGMQLWDIVFPF